MRLLIVGATGGTGRQLAEQALARGHTVTALVRTPSKLAVQRERLTLTRGDVLDYSAVEATVRGQDAVLSALGHKQWFYPTSILSRGTDNLVRAMQLHGVRRFTCETSLGVADSWARLGLYYTLFVRIFIVGFYFRDKARQERLLRASGLDWVIVRPGLLTDAAPRGVYRAGPDIGHWLWSVRISRADVAGFMLNQLTEDRYVHTAVGLAW